MLSRTSKYRDLMTTIVPKHKVSILYTPLNTRVFHKRCPWESFKKRNSSNKYRGVPNTVLYPGTKRSHCLIFTTWFLRHRDLSPGLHDGGWHHVCFTWSNSDGELCPHVNGEVLTCFTDYKTGETIPGNGQFILGQEQDAYGKLFIRER